MLPFRPKLIIYTDPPIVVYYQALWGLFRFTKHGKTGPIQGYGLLALLPKRQLGLFGNHLLDVAHKNVSALIKQNHLGTKAST